MMRIVFAALILIAIFEVQAMEENEITYNGHQYPVAPKGGITPAELSEKINAGRIEITMENFIKAALSGTPIGEPGSKFVIVASNEEQ